MINLEKGQKRQGKGQKTDFQENSKKPPYLKSRKFLFSVWNILTKKTKLNSCVPIMTLDAQSHFTILRFKKCILKFYNLATQVKIDEYFERGYISKI